MAAYWPGPDTALMRDAAPDVALETELGARACWHWLLASPLFAAGPHLCRSQPASTEAAS